ncbi:MAG: hypothetical protein ACJAUB_001081 [Cryomorphaceae bacterium]|jgi:hypothetical protein
MRIFAICLFVLCAWGCDKESNMEMQSTSIKQLDTDTDYLARSIVSLPDGSVIMGSVGLEDENGGAGYGFRPSLMAKYNPQGDLEWVIDLPQEVYVLWKCIVLDDGNILAVGLGDTPNSQYVGAAIIDESGEVLHLESIFNNVSGPVSTPLKYSSVDAIQAQGGNILLVMPQQIVDSGNMNPRIIVLDKELSILQDIDYEIQEGPVTYTLLELVIEQAINGDIFLSGRIYSTPNGSTNPFVGIIRLNHNLEIVDSKRFSSASTPFGFTLTGAVNSRTEIASNIAIDASGSPVFVASLRNPSDSLFEPIFNLRGQDYFMRAPQLGLWHITSQDVEAPIKQVTGFPANAIIQKIKSTSDGGFIMVGTCGINTNQALPSQYRMLVFKTDPSLNVQWMVYPQMQFATLGADIIESANGYIVTATQHSLGEINKPFLFKLNQSGIVE